jgi:hypothetical protein
MITKAPSVIAIQTGRIWAESVALTKSKDEVLEVVLDHPDCPTDMVNYVLFLMIIQFINGTL